MAHQVTTNGRQVDGGATQADKLLWRKYLLPGLGVKRWLVVGAAGIAITSVGLAFLIKNVFRLAAPDFLPWHSEGILLGAVGVGVIILAMYGLYRSVSPLLFASASINTLADTIYTRRSRGRGPRIAAIGGGTGLSVLLRGLKPYTDNLSAIVTVADDGGSSGRLRREMGVLPPGDFRNCLVAMSDAESLLGDLFQHRFDQGEGLEGHSFGNLFILAMTNVTGSFERALYESSRVLAVHGQILPATVANLRLSARLADGTVVHGESSITDRGGAIEELMVEPRNAEAYAPAVEAIQEAQLILMGPGSLYTSVLPNLLVSGIAEAIRDSQAPKVYVCNVATQKGETDRYSVEEHVAALQRHTFSEVADYVVANSTPVRLGTEFAGQPVLHGTSSMKHASLIEDDLVDPDHPVRHDADKLANVVMDVYHGKRRALAAAPVGMPDGK